MARHDVGRADEVKPGAVKMVRVQGTELGIFLVGDEYRAYRNACPHAGAPVCAGFLDGSILRCPWHGWEFDLHTGEHLVNRAIALERFPVEIEGDRLFVVA